MQRICIDLGKDPHPARAATSGDAAPSLAAVLGAPLNAAVIFFRNNTQEALAADSTGKLVLKKKGARNDAALFSDVTMTPDGSGAATVYEFGGRLFSDELVAAIGEDESITLVGCVTWTEPEEDEQICEDFEFVVKNSAARDGDSIPATTDARWAWLKEAAPEANGFTHDDEAKTLAVDGAGGGGSLLAANLLTANHTATVDDLGANVFTDLIASGSVMITLPLMADAIAHGGSIRVVAGREWNSDNNFICVYPPSSEWSPNRFIIGSQVLFSLYSTGKGDELELLPIDIEGTKYWHVIRFTGLWQDRD